MNKEHVLEQICENCPAEIVASVLTRSSELDMKVHEILTMEIFVRYQGACLTERPPHFVRPGCATKPTSTPFTLHTSVSVSHQHRTHIVLGLCYLAIPSICSRPHQTPVSQSPHGGVHQLTNSECIPTCLVIRHPIVNRTYYNPSAASDKTPSKLAAAPPSPAAVRFSLHLLFFLSLSLSLLCRP
jgi:hypothetical protein